MRSQQVTQLLLVDSPPDLARVDSGVEAVRNMGAANIVARIKSKVEALRRDLGLLHWIFGFGFAALNAAAIAHLFRSAI